MHHFAFLDWLPTHIFSTPNYPLLAPKTHFLAAILPFLAMYFMVQKGFVYTLSVDIYAFRTALSTILHCVLHLFTLHLAPKRTAFSTKMHCVLVLNAGYFAANSPKVGANGGSLEYKFILPHSHADPFLHQNEPSRESIFCDKVSTWWIKRALMRLKFLLKTRQKCLCRIPTREQRH